MEEIADLIQQGRELMAAGRYEAAEKIFDRALSLDKKYGPSYLHLGNAQMNLGKVDEAIANFKKAAMFEDTAADANYSIACAEFIKGDTVAAIKQFNKCEGLGISSVDMYGIMAVIFMDADDPAQAIRCMNKAIQLEPLNPQPRLDKAQIYMTQGKNKEAINVLREAEDLLPDVANTYIVEAELFSSMGENDNAVKTMNRALERFPEDPSLHVVLARALNSSGKYAEALKAVEKANEIAGRELSAENREAALQMGIAYAGLRDIDKSIASLQAACAKNPGDNDLAYLLMSECYSEKRYAEARAAAKDILAKEDVLPRYRAAALYNEIICDKAMGNCEGIDDRLKNLAKVLRKITIANPGLMDVYVYRLLTYKELKQFDKANEMADHLTSVAPKSAMGYAFKADIAVAQGDEDSANTYRQKALELDPDFKF